MSGVTFDHYTIRAKDVGVSAQFYHEVMGFRIQTFDNFDFPFVMLFAGEQGIVHLLGVGAALDAFLGRQAPAYGSGAARRTGNLEHVAFNATDRAGFVQRLERAKVKYHARTLADYGVQQLLFEDPDGIEIEVNFPLSE